MVTPTLSESPMVLSEKGSSSAQAYQIYDAKGRYLMRKVTGPRSDKRWFVKEIAVIGKPILENAPTVPIPDGNL
jgi:hypothetical protein